MIDSSAIVVVNKVDLVDDCYPREGWDPDNKELDSSLRRNDNEGCGNNGPLYISIKQKLNLDALISAITAKAESLAGNGETVSITRERHRHHITMSVEALERCNIKDDLVLAAEDLRIAARNLSLMTGKIEVEEILGEIFQNFCIGK